MKNSRILMVVSALVIGAFTVMISCEKDSGAFFENPVPTIAERTTPNCLDGSVTIFSDGLGEYVTVEMASGKQYTGLGYNQGIPAVFDDSEFTFTSVMSNYTNSKSIIEVELVIQAVDRNGNAFWARSTEPIVPLVTTSPLANAFDGEIEKVDPQTKYAKPLIKLHNVFGGKFHREEPDVPNAKPIKELYNVFDGVVEKEKSPIVRHMPVIKLHNVFDGIIEKGEAPFKGKKVQSPYEVLYFEGEMALADATGKFKCSWGTFLVKGKMDLVNGTMEYIFEGELCGNC